VYHLAAGGTASWYDFVRHIVSEALLSGCNPGGAQDDQTDFQLGVSSGDPQMSQLDVKLMGRVMPGLMPEPMILCWRPDNLWLRLKDARAKKSRVPKKLPGVTVGSTMMPSAPLPCPSQKVDMANI
jgi:hypothetical protein